MTRRFTFVYGIAIAIAFVFIGLAVTLTDFSDVVRLVIASPGVGALFVALFQVLRDVLAHERQRALQEQQQAFQVGAASHMANVAFDKHVGFCEAYIAKVLEVVDILLQNGATKEVLGPLLRLYEIRREYAPWLPGDVVGPLQEFERTLRQVGVGRDMLEGLPVGEERAAAVGEMWSAFRELVEAGDNEEDGSPGVAAYEKVIAWLQGVLGIAQLTQLRQVITVGATRSMAGIRSGSE